MKAINKLAEICGADSTKELTFRFKGIKYKRRGLAFMKGTVEILTLEPCYYTDYKYMLYGKFLYVNDLPLVLYGANLPALKNKLIKLLND